MNNFLFLPKKGAMLLFSFLILAMLFPMVSAVAPTTTIFTGDVGINVEINVMPTYQQGEARWSIIHLFNTTNGYQITNATNDNITCHMHLRDSQGFELFVVEAVADTDHWDLNGSGGVANTIGDYAWTVTCQDGTAQVGGYASGYFEIIQDPDIVLFTDATSDWRIFLILVIIAFALLVIALYTENYIFAFFAGLLFLLAGIYGMIYGFDNINDFYTRAISSILLGMGLIITVLSGLNISKDAYTQKKDDNF